MAGFGVRQACSSVRDARLSACCRKKYYILLMLEPEEYYNSLLEGIELGLPARQKIVDVKLH